MLRIRLGSMVTVMGASGVGEPLGHIMAGIVIPQKESFGVPGLYPAVGPGVCRPTSDERCFPLADCPGERALPAGETEVGKP